MRWAYQAKTEKNKQALIDLARSWTQAAVQSEILSSAFDIATLYKAPRRIFAHQLKQETLLLLGFGLRGPKQGLFGILPELVGL